MDIPVIKNNSITAIILTYNEEIHIERCIRSIKPIVDKIFIVDSFSSDRTVEIARGLGAEVVQRPFKKYADQFQWGIYNSNADTEWLMRMDADEYFESGLQLELSDMLKNISNDTDGIYLKRKVFFQGQWIRFGGFYPHIILRIWRIGKGHIEQRWMDESIILPFEAKTIILKEHLVDDNLKGITFWIDKHNRYATREAIDLLNNKYPLYKADEGLLQMDDPQTRRKRIIKNRVYSKLPTVLRAFTYFIYRYFFLFGFLDGKKGFLWHFLQGFWYRLLVDIKIMEIEERSKGNVQEIHRILREQHNITI
jgi:glycosyltransferase involved in cell wall biosynthesis